MDYLLHILVVLSIYSILSYSLDLLVGYLGLLSVAHAAFYGVGAYAAALAGLRAGLPFPAMLGIAMLASASVCVLVSLPAASLRGDALMMSTLCAQVIVLNLFFNVEVVTGGAQGLRNVPGASALGIELHSLPRFAFLCAALATLCVLATRHLVRGSYGRLLRAVREDEVFVQSVGRRPELAKISVMVYSAALAGVAGALFAAYYSYVSPSSFGLMESVLILSMVLIGGSGTPFGPFLGALLLVLLPEGLRFLGLPPATAAHLRQVVYGLLLIAVVVAGAEQASQAHRRKSS